MSLPKPSFAICVLALAHSGIAPAEPPSLKLQAGTLLPSTSWWTSYPSGTTHTIGVAAPTAPPPELAELARALSRGGACTQSCYATAVYEYIRNNIALEFRFGLSKGARGAVIDQSGTAFDQADLMVVLLELGGVGASYQVGTITLTGAQFQNWTGFTNAAPACQFLADGGIPATVNGATSCTSSSLTGATVSSISMAHVWVSALGNLYDPSFKTNIVKPSTDLGSALGCGTGCGSAAQTALLQGSSAGTLGGAPTLALASSSASNLGTTMSGYAIALEHYIQQKNGTNYLTTNPNLQVEDLIGGLVIDTNAPIPPSFATLPYTSTVQYTWAGTNTGNSTIPDQFRTTLEVNLVGLFDAVTYADETAGRRLKILAQAVAGTQTETNATMIATLYSDWRPIASNTLAVTYNQPPFQVLLTASHPVPTASTYLRETLSYLEPLIEGCGPNSGCANWFADVLTIVQAYGDSTESTAAHFAALQQRDAEEVWYENLPPYSQSNPDPRHIYPMGYSSGQHKTDIHCMYTGSSYWSYPHWATACMQQHQGTLTANWIAAASRGATLAAGVNNVARQLHHLLGVVNSGDNTNYESTFNVQGSLSVNSLAPAITSGASMALDRSAAFASIAAVLDRLEGTAIEQQGNYFTGDAAVTMMASVPADGIAFVDVTSAALWSSVQGSLTNYDANTITAIGQYFQDSHSYEVILPQNLQIASQPPVGALAAFDAQTDRIAYLTWDNDVLNKGGAGPSDPAGILSQMTTIADYSAKGRSRISVDSASGDYTLSPAPDIVTGGGGFPYSLAYQRVYSPTSGSYTCDSKPGCVRSEQELSGLPFGWTHSLVVTARLGNDPFASFGRTSALDASSVLAALYVTRQLNNVATLTFQSKVTTAFVADWLGKALAGNVVSVRRPPQTSAFVRLPDNSFNPAPGNAETLVESGSSSRVMGVNSVGLYLWNNSGLKYLLTDKDGAQIQFGYGSDTSWSPDNAYRSLFVANSWTFPAGLVVSYQYTGPGLVSPENAPCLTQISNSLGRSLTFNNMCVDGAAGTSAQTVTDDSGRLVSISMLGAGGAVLTTGTASYTPPLRLNYVYGPADVPEVTSLLITAPDGAAISQYDYAAWPTAPVARDPYKITDWVVPSDHATGKPFIRLGLDSLSRIETTTDNTSSTCCTTTYFISGIFGTENQKQTQIVDPLGALTTNYFDRWSSLLQTIDPDNGVTSYLYDTGRRLIQKTLPELNGFTYTYDVRANLLSTTRHPKPGSTLATSTTSTTYKEAQTVFPCVSPNTCNRPLYEYDAKSNQTTYAWNTNGTLSSITYPTVVDGSTTVGTPLTSYGYTSYGLVNLKTQRVWQNPAIVNLVTQYTYNATSKYTLSSMVVDYGGKNLTTVYTFDNGGTGPGNVTSITDPNSNVTGYKYDALRRLKEIDAPLSATTLYTYDLDGQLTSTQKFDSTRSAYQTEVKYYYPTGDLAYVVHPDANPTAPAQGASTTVTSLPCPASYTTCYTYDADGRTLATSEPLTATTIRVSASAYDADGRRLCTWRGFGTIASAITQVTGSTPCAWTPSSYTQTSALRYDLLAYSANGKVNQSTDSDGNLTTLVYDGFDRLSQMILPGATLGTAAPCHAIYTAGDNCEQYGYDNNDNRQTKANRSGNTISYSFDAMNQEYQRQVPANVNGHFSRTLNETYDLLGRKYQATADSQTLTFNFDSAGRLGSVVDSIIGTVGYGYDAASNRTQITWPDNYVATYAYDALSRLCKVKENTATTCATNDSISSLIVQYTWDTLSRRQSLAFGNGVTTGWSYFKDSALMGMTHTIGSKSLALSYTRNQVNQLSTQAVAITDPTGVLTPESFILQPGSASSTAYVANNLNQYATVGGVTNGFDLNGNLTSDGTYTYEYDEENRLRSATGSGNTITYEYDPLGRRRAKTVNGTMTRFLSDDQEEIGEYTSTPSLLRRYLNGHSLDEHLVQIEAAGTHYYFQTNHQGTTLLTSDTSSTPVLTSFRYGAYGDSNSATTGAAFRYTGRRLDPETGLYYYRARYYSPTLGRFLQTDPVGDKDDTNLYSYVYDDPVNRTDPTGQWAWIDDGIALGAGALGGLIAQGFEDVISGHLSSGGEYVASAIGGAVTTETALYTVPTMGPAGLVVAGTAGSVVTDVGKSIATGKPLDVKSTAVNAALSAGTGGLAPEAKTGLGALAKQILTKFKNSQIKSVTTKTAVKSVAGKAATDAPGSVIGGAAAGEKDNMEQNNHTSTAPATAQEVPDPNKRS